MKGKDLLEKLKRESINEWNEYEINKIIGVVNNFYRIDDYILIEAIDSIIACYMTTTVDPTDCTAYDILSLDRAKILYGEDKKTMKSLIEEQEKINKAVEKILSER